MSTIQEGSAFPAFSLSDQDGNIVTNEDLKGGKSVIYFYPKDDTTGCTAEACEFREILPSLDNAKVYGVSPDNAKSHKKFIAKYDLTFPLLVDEEHRLADELGIWVEKSMYGKTYMGIERTTYVLDSEAKIIRIFRKVKPQGHAAEVAEALK